MRLKTAAFTQIALARVAQVGETLDSFVVVEVFRDTGDGEALVTLRLVVPI